MKNIVTLLFGAVMAAALTACSDDADSPQTVGKIITPEVHEEPVTDQLAVTVTATLPTAVFGQFDDNSTGAALLRRLSAPSADIDFNSRLVLLQGSVFDGTAAMIQEQLYAMVTATDAAQNYVFNPCEWRLYGRKSKGDKWVLLATVNDRNNKGDGLPWTNSTVKAKQFDVAPNAMQYFRLEADSWSYAMQLAEFYFTF